MNTSDVSAHTARMASRIAALAMRHPLLFGFPHILPSPCWFVAITLNVVFAVVSEGAGADHGAGLDFTEGSRRHTFNTFFEESQFGD